MDIKQELIKEPAKVHVYAWLARSPRILLFREGDEEPLAIASNEANARLIAAAPDLLEALQAYVEIASNGTTSTKYTQAQINAQTAINKALGGN